LDTDFSRKLIHRPVPDIPDGIPDNMTISLNRLTGSNIYVILASERVS